MSATTITIDGSRVKLDTDSGRYRTSVEFLSTVSYRDAVARMKDIYDGYADDYKRHLELVYRFDAEMRRLMVRIMAADTMNDEARNG
jgi:hypothetical protein